MPSRGKIFPNYAHTSVSWFKLDRPETLWIPQRELTMNLEYLNLILAEVYRLGTQLALCTLHHV